VQRLEQTISPAQLSRALGLGESTVKRWIDQGRIPAERTPGGHRRVRLCDALRFLRGADVAGSDPAALGAAGGDETSPETLAALLCSDAPGEAVTLLEALYASGVTAGDLSDRWVGPAMHRIGNGWEAGEVSITVEHRATAVMLGALHGLIRVQAQPTTAAPRAFVAALAQDPYLLAPLCAELVLNEAGFRTTNFGPDTPPDSLVQAIREQRPALVAVSFSVPEATGGRARAALGAACRESGSALVVGGRGLESGLADDLSATAWCRSMTELARMARHLSGASAPQNLSRTG
jgi:excisionase family DNA binding protein